MGDSPIHDKKNTFTRILRPRKRGRKPTNDVSANKITTFLVNMSKPTGDSLSFPEYLNVAHELNEIKKDEDIETDKHVILSDFFPEPRSLSQILRISPL